MSGRVEEGNAGSSTSLRFGRNDNAFLIERKGRPRVRYPASLRDVGHPFLIGEKLAAEIAIPHLCEMWGTRLVGAVCFGEVDGVVSDAFAVCHSGFDIGAIVDARVEPGHRRLLQLRVEVAGAAGK